MFGTGSQAAMACLLAHVHRALHDHGLRQRVLGGLRSSLRDHGGGSDRALHADLARLAPARMRCITVRLFMSAIQLYDFM